MRTAKIHKALGVLLAAAVLAAALLSLAFVAGHAGHHCAEANCAVCVQLHHAKEQLESAAATPAGPPAAGPVALLVFAVLCLAGLGLAASPVLLKVRMDD